MAIWLFWLSICALPQDSTLIAFIGDQGDGSDARAVLQMIAEKGCDAVVHAGDFDYDDDPEGWISMIREFLGDDFPYFAAAGNHDEDEWYGDEGYQVQLEEQLFRAGIEWSGELGVMSTIVWRDFRIVLTAPDIFDGGDGDVHAGYIASALEGSDQTWHISCWHKNMREMQVGGKGNETGWGVYEASRRAGCIIATGHEHSYSRTHLLSSCRDQTVAGVSSPLQLAIDDPLTPEDEGRCVVFVSGIAGRSIRDQERNGPWWASIYTSDQDATFGALFIEFEGSEAVAYFEAIDGSRPDEFSLRAPSREPPAPEPMILLDLDRSPDLMPARVLEIEIAYEDFDPSSAFFMGSVHRQGEDPPASSLFSLSDPSLIRYRVNPAFDGYQATFRILALSGMDVVVSDVIEIIWSDHVPIQEKGYLLSSSRIQDGIDPEARFRVVEDWASRDWSYRPSSILSCSSADDPGWLDDRGGAAIVYAKAIAYHVTGDEQYAEEVEAALDAVSKVTSLPEGSDFPGRQCWLNASWGVPEYIYAADLIAEPLDRDIYDRFSVWLASIYRMVSLGDLALNNWGAAHINTCGLIADYLTGRDIVLEHREPPWRDGGVSKFLSPEEATALVQARCLDAMSGHSVSFWSSSACDDLSDRSQDPSRPPVKSMITPEGILPDDARREQYCNIEEYDGSYQSYPQLTCDHLIAYAELRRIRGDLSVYEQIELSPMEITYDVFSEGRSVSYELPAGRGSLKRAILAILEAGTEWRKDPALSFALRHYGDLGVVLDRPYGTSQGICFGTLE